MIVYLITNKINGKQYVGMTGRSLEARWSAHKSSTRNGSPFRFHSAIRKYGEENFEASILYDDLSIEECRTIEEKTILEYNTTINGYNANPGGCGGWIVPDEKYDSWLMKITEKSTLESNGRWSGYSDEFILEECAKIFKSYSNKEEFSFKGILREIRKKHDSIPKSFSKNRFLKYGGCFKTALSIKLDIPLEELFSLSKKKSQRHKEALSKSNFSKNNNWYSNDALKISKMFNEYPGDGWVRGRKYGYKN